MSSVAFSPDGQYLASAARDVTIWRISDGRKIGQLAERNPTSLAFSPDGEYLAVGTLVASSYADGRQDKHGEVHLWRINTNQIDPEHVLRTDDFVYFVAFSPDGQYLAAAGSQPESGGSPLGSWEIWPSRRTIMIWHTNADWSARTLTSPQNKISGLAWSPDGQRLASSGSKRVCVWRVD